MSLSAKYKKKASQINLFGGDPPSTSPTLTYQVTFIFPTVNRKPTVTVFTYTGPTTCPVPASRVRVITSAGRPPLMISAIGEVKEQFTADSKTPLSGATSMTFVHLASTSLLLISCRLAPIGIFTMGWGCLALGLESPLRIRRRVPSNFLDGSPIRMVRFLGTVGRYLRCH